MHGRVLGSVILLLGALRAVGADAKADFRDAAVHRYGDEQIRFLQAYVAEKKDTPESPATSLLASILFAQASEVRPPMSLSALGADPGLRVSLLIGFAEALYAEEQFDAAREILGLLSKSSLAGDERRYQSLMLRLALHAGEKNSPPPLPVANDPLFRLNQALMALQAEGITAAVQQLRVIAGDGKALPAERDRAALWLAVLSSQSGSESDVLQALAMLDSQSPLKAEAWLAALRIFRDVDPVAASAIEHYLASRVGDSAGRWEARDYVVRSLLTRDATGQAGSQAVEAMALLSSTLGRLEKQLAELDRLPFEQLLPMIDGLPDGAQTRARELVGRRDSLNKAADVLRRWRPDLAVIQQRLQTDPQGFDQQLRDALMVVRRRAEANARDLSQVDRLFRHSLNQLVGSPPDSNKAYRLFFGVSLWEIGYEYPEEWRRVVKDPAEGKKLDRTQKNDIRRMLEEEARRQKKLDQQLLPKVLGHTDRLLATLAERTGKRPGSMFVGMAERANDLGARSKDKIDELERFLPSIEQAVRDEIRRHLLTRRDNAQRWLNRFAGHALAIFAAHREKAVQPYFELRRPLPETAGQTLVDSVRSLSGEPKMAAAGEIDMVPVLTPLQSLASTGGSRQIRADALRLSAELTVALFEAQAIPSAAGAIGNYLTLQRDYADLVDRAEISYQLARAQDLGQRMDDSLATLSSFVKNFPADLRSGEALFRIGEIQFTQGDYPAARQAYESVIQRGQTSYRDQAEYKLGWSLFKTGEFRKALPPFIAVLDRAAGSQHDSDGQQQERIKDTFRAVALTFAYMNGAADVEQYFSQVASRGYVADIYFNLAHYYLEHDRINDAASAYEYLVRQSPTDARAPLLLADVIAAARAEQLSKLALEYQERFIDVYAVGGAYWTQASAAVREQINQRMQPYLADLGQMYHADAQQNRGSQSYVKAIKYYGQYIATFPKDAQTPKFHFLMAEARFETGDFPGALADYERAAYQYGMHPDAAAAAYAALVANQQLAGQATGADEQKRQLRELVGRGERFATVFPGDLRVDDVLVKVAEDLLLLAEPGEAARLAERLIARQPADAVRRRAWTVLAHGRFDSRQFVEAELAYQQALKEKGGAPEFQEALRGRLALAVYRQAEAHRAAGNVDLAIADFLRVGKTAPGTEPVPSAEIDAAVLLLQSRQWGKAIRIFEAFQQTYPSHPLAADVPARLAFAYENDGQLLKAADLLEAISQQQREPKDDALSRQMAWRAGELRDKGGRADLAVASYQRYLLRYPAPLEKATEVRQLLADLAAKDKDPATRDRWLNDIISHARAVDDAGPRVRYLAARAALVFGDGQAAAFNEIALRLPLDKALAAKRGAMEQALKWYEEAGRFGVVEVTTAATYKIAELYRHLAGDVLASERPGGLSELELGQYNILLEEESFPFEEKAAEFHALNHQRIRSGIYDEWIVRSLESLRKLVPARYDRVESRLGYFDYVAPKTVIKEDVKSSALPATDKGMIPDPAPESTGGNNAAPRS